MSGSDLTIPPHSIEAEQLVLGALLCDTDGEIWERVAGLVVAEHFYRRDHRTLFKAMSKLAEAGKPLSPVSVKAQLEQWGELEEAGGWAYLLDLFKNTIPTAGVEHYAGIILERGLERGLMGAHMLAWEDLQNPELSAVEKSERIQLRLQEAVAGVATGSEVPLIREAAKDFICDLERRFESGSDMVGMSTGFTGIDEATLGLCPGDLVILAARPSMGKSTLVQNIATNAAESNKQSVYIASLEMPRQQLIGRMAAAVGRIPFRHVRSGKLQEGDWPRLTAFMATMRDWRLAVDDRTTLTLDDLRASVRRHKRKFGLHLLVLDYLQLMTINGRKNGTRADDVSELTRGLKKLAGELQVPIIALSQLNRSVEQRANKRPMMSDLRESGAIEQDADTIMFLYRDEVYNPESTSKGYAELIFAKQRNGEQGVTVPLASRLDQCRFEDVSMRHLHDDWRGEPGGDGL